MRGKGPLRERLDDAFPTVVRYCGLLLALGLGVANILGEAKDFASGYVAALGMVLYKTIKRAASDGED